MTTEPRPKRIFSDEHLANLRRSHLGIKPSEETRAKMSAARLGRSLSDEHRAKLSASRQGFKHSPERLARQSESHKRGTNVGYKAAHWRAAAVLPKTCEWADTTCKGSLDAAFRHGDAPEEFVRQDDLGTYYVGPDPRDGYMRLCRSHHFRYDFDPHFTPPAARG